VISFEKERFLAEFPFFFFMWSTRVNKEVMWEKQVFNFADGLIDRETNSKNILLINKRFINLSIIKYIGGQVNS
jgi:hypothetical protein